MYTLGRNYCVPPIHAEGLRYHGMAPTIGLLYKYGTIKTVSYNQTEVFKAATLFARLEGLIPAPESAYAVKAVIDLARKYRNEKLTILFNLSGHGLLDLSAYRDLLDNKLVDYEYSNSR